ncbi:MAG: hypothetical protein A3K07_01795 [Candidatus Doudnabacteria bacterium RIFCSPHIGHO2_01_43_10]|nr:MAG: hypothetical protein A3K07_01795 [Candidatus Doudnabacteria bacterium RIFCSPHIGHO2_01_43_10]
MLVTLLTLIYSYLFSFTQISINYQIQGREGTKRLASQSFPEGGSRGERLFVDGEVGSELHRDLAIAGVHDPATHGGDPSALGRDLLEHQLLDVLVVAQCHLLEVEIEEHGFDTVIGEYRLGDPIGEDVRWLGPE